VDPEAMRALAAIFNHPPAAPGNEAACVR